MTLVDDLNGSVTAGGQGSGTSAGFLTSGAGSTNGTAGMGTGSSGTAGTGAASSSASTGSTTAAIATGTATGSITGSTGGTGTGTGNGSGTTTGAACTPDTWASFAGTFFKTYCAQCHNWTKAAVAQDAQITPELQKGFMPPRTAKLQPSPQDLNRILVWIGCGEP